jgi:hypothetical protein
MQRRSYQSAHISPARTPSGNAYTGARIGDPSRDFRPESTIEHRRGGGADDLSAEVPVEGHRRVGVAELVGDLARSEAGLVEPSRDGLAEYVRGRP